ncbi:ABC transporter permease [Tuberibacillus sp. Marseille-P3662]|uniref:ABC transporter permease n=1 Tax=Tuberibacillus sp. Marseille-P3662 TaxID=1965358 RepID=UPI000A1C9AE8|nr:ABC transporter permease [Tuberibacillus sp. Marseille-P3662]
MKGSRLLKLLLIVIMCLTVIFLFLPVVAIFFDLTPGDLWSQLTTPLAYQALKLSFFTTLTSLVLIILFGTPLAYFLASKSFPGKQVLEVVIQLPIVIPAAVAGVGLLMVFGRFGFIGQLLAEYGINVGFTSVAVVLAQCFVAAPFYIQSARTAFSEIDPMFISASRTLGMSKMKTSFRIIIPLAMPGLISGAALSWGRALGEFGATIMFAGNLPGETQTLPLAIFTAMQSKPSVAIAISALLIIVAFFLLLAVKLIGYWPKMKQSSHKRKERRQVYANL